MNNTPDHDIEENLKIVQQIMIEAIRLNVTGKQETRFSYYNASGKLEISLAYSGNAAFYDGLTRTWNVSIRNKELLNAVLEELKSLQPPLEDQVEDDFLG